MLAFFAFPHLSLDGEFKYYGKEYFKLCIDITFWYSQCNNFSRKITDEHTPLKPIASRIKNVSIIFCNFFYATLETVEIKKIIFCDYVRIKIWRHSRSLILSCFVFLWTLSSISIAEYFYFYLLCKSAAFFNKFEVTKRMGYGGNLHTAIISGHNIWG